MQEKLKEVVVDTPRNNDTAKTEEKYTSQYVTEKLTKLLRIDKDLKSHLESALALKNGNLDVDSIVNPNSLTILDNARRQRIISIIGTITLELTNLVDPKERQKVMKTQCLRIANVSNPDYDLKNDNE